MSTRFSPAAAVVTAFVSLTAVAVITASSQSQGTQAAGLPTEAQQAIALCDLAQEQANKTQYREARESALRCLEIAERFSHAPGIARASLLLGSAAEFSGDWAEARLRATKAIDAFAAAGDLGGRAIATMNLFRAGGVAPADAERLTARTIDDARKSGKREVEASAFHGWGDGLFSQGQYEAAFEKLEVARSIYEALGDRVALGTVFNSLGRVYRGHGQLQEALRLQLKALELHEAAGNPLTLVQSLNAVGSVHGMLGHLKESRDYYERALVIAEQSSSGRIPDLLRANLANTLSQQGESARAATMLEEIISRGLDAYPSLRHSHLSYARVQNGQPREGLAAARRAVELCGTAANDCILALLASAQAHAALGDQTAALADTTAALNRIEEVRKQLVPTDFFKQDFHHALQSIYSAAIALNRDTKDVKRALETAELARSRAFADLLASRGVEPEKESLVFRGPDASSGLKSRVTIAPASVGDIAASARRLGSTFLVYWVADDGLTAWTVTPDGAVRARRVNVLRSKLEDLVRATSPTESNVAPAAWRELYDLVIKPVRDALPRATGSLITIVPHGPLVALSFAGLQDARGRYLLEDYTIHYAPAASVLQFTSAAKHAAGRTGNMLLVADPSLPPPSRLDKPLPRLPGARAEVDAIGRLVPRQRVTTLRDSSATETGVRAAAAGKSVLHFATHAIVRNDDPFGSFLALAVPSGDATSDGLLTAQEVYGWKLDADLVVLSACRSGGGRVVGDGIATFARAFIYAGTPSLVVSLWDVADQPANRLIPGFYRSWLGGQSKARALRAAQLQLLRDLRAGKVQIQTPAGLVTLPEHPVFWAGFALIGEPE